MHFVIVTKPLRCGRVIRRKVGNWKEMSRLDWNVRPVTKRCVENRRPKTSGWEDYVRANVRFGSLCECGRVGMGYKTVSVT